MNTTAEAVAYLTDRLNSGDGPTCEVRKERLELLLDAYRRQREALAPFATETIEWPDSLRNSEVLACLAETEHHSPWETDFSFADINKAGDVFRST